MRLSLELLARWPNYTIKYDRPASKETVLVSYPNTADQDPLQILYLRSNGVIVYTMTTVTTTETNVPDQIWFYRCLLFYLAVSSSVRSDLCYRIRTVLLLNR